MSRPRALENVRVVDFSWVRAGPWATRWLGAFGAEIIKSEWPGKRARQATEHHHASESSGQSQHLGKFQ